MPRPDTRAAAVQNRRFLHELTRTGNVRDAARRADCPYGTIQHRRRTDAAFAQAWDVALATAQARLDALGPHGPTRRGIGAATLSGAAAHRTAGGEPVVVRRNDGRLQVRRAQPGKLTRQGEQAFLLALSATANVTLSAAAAGASEAAFYRRRRNNPAFAREWRDALSRGYGRIEQALLASARPQSHADDAWRHNEPPELPPMSVNQAMQLLWHHQRTAELLEEPGTIRRRPREPEEIYRLRLAEMWRMRQQRDRDAFTVAEALRHAGEGLQEGEAALVLPDWGVVGQ